MRQVLDGCKELPDDWVTTAILIRETGREVYVGHMHRAEDE